MASLGKKFDQPWRTALVPATFRKIPFKVEDGSYHGGRRIALHSYPKRDDPYAEDMGRRERRFQITGYLIGPRYHEDRAKLHDALELEGPAPLELFQRRTFWQLSVVVEEFTFSESRERGGYCTIEMRFVEVGTAGNTLNVGTAGAQVVANTANQVEQQATVEFGEIIMGQ